MLNQDQITEQGVRVHLQGLVILKDKKKKKKQNRKEHREGTME